VQQLTESTLHRIAEIGGVEREWDAAILARRLSTTGASRGRARSLADFALVVSP
jgi:hypothetical protein